MLQYPLEDTAIQLASYQLNARNTFGVIQDDRISDLASPDLPDLRTFLATNATPNPSAPTQALHQITFLPVIPNPDKILCVGLNFLEHIREVGKKIEDYPLLFIRLASSQVGHLQPILRPRASDHLDFEGELAIIIGKHPSAKPARHILKEDALAYVAGYTIYNDASVRDWQRHTTQYTPGKNFPATGASGPCMTTADEIPDPTQLHLTTRLNGNVVQDSGLHDLRFSIPEIIAYISTFTELLPGDVISTGTPSGVGAARKPPLWLQPGDTIEVEIPKIGKLINPVQQEP